MYKITNLVGSPMTLQTKTGSVILPANGCLVVDLDSQYMSSIRHCQFITIECAPSPKVNDADAAEKKKSKRDK